MKYIVLYSGGIDSVAVLLILEQLGLDYEIAHFIVSPRATKHALLTLYQLGIRKPIHVWDYRHFLQAVSSERPMLTCLACKKAMIRLASNLGMPLTGDSLGQVASQTLHNLKIIGPAARPLLGSDKEDVDLFIMRVLKDRGRAELVRKGSVYGCPFKPSKPVVRGTKKVAQEVLALVEKYLHTVKYLGMKRVSDLTALG